MSEGYYRVNHSLFITSYTKAFGSNGTWKELWEWDVYTADLGGSVKIRCVCNSNGRNMTIPWFETEDLDITGAVKAACLKEMERNIK
ncbi:hypothetical protein [Virgibacillus ainsalahensis]